MHESPHLHALFNKSLFHWELAWQSRDALECCRVRKSSSPINQDVHSINSSIVQHFDSLTAEVVSTVGATLSRSGDNCGETLWDWSDDSVWTRLDRWSRWGMNSCRRERADRTWSVTRWLWRDRYTPSWMKRYTAQITHIFIHLSSHSFDCVHFSSTLFSLWSKT